MGDNTAIFTPSDETDSHYQTALKLSKYLNTLKICKNKEAENCSDLYYPIRYSVKEYGNGIYSAPQYPKLLLSDGAVYTVQQMKCGGTYNSCVTDENGNCKKDENGEITPIQSYKKDCGYIIVDVNGAKGTDMFGKDVFWLRIYKDYMKINPWAPSGGTAGNDIMTGKLILKYVIFQKNVLSYKYVKY